MWKQEKKKYVCREVRGVACVKEWPTSIAMVAWWDGSSANVEQGASPSLLHKPSLPNQWLGDARLEGRGSGESFTSLVTPSRNSVRAAGLMLTSSTPAH